MFDRIPAIVGRCKTRVAVRDGIGADRVPTVTLLPHPLNKTFSRPFAVVLPVGAALPTDEQWPDLISNLAVGRIVAIDCEDLPSAYRLFERILSATGRLPASRPAGAVGGAP